MSADAAPDPNFFLCLHMTAGVRAHCVLCAFHARDPDVEVVRRNGDKVHIRDPACFYCEAERNTKRRLERERGSEVSVEEARRFIAAARKVDTGGRRQGYTLKEYASGGRSGHEDR